MPKIKVQNEVSSEPTEAKEHGVWLGESKISEMAVAQAFDLDQKEVGKYKEKIDTILQYAKTQTDSFTPANIKWIIKDLELKLGSPPLSEKRISYVARYAYLAQEKAKINKEMDSYNPLEND